MPQRVASTAGNVTVPDRGRGGGVLLSCVRVRRSGVRGGGSGAHARQLDRSGRRSALVGDRRGFRFPHLSPDGTRVAVTIDPRPSQIWVYDLVRQSSTPLATTGHSLSPIWTVDGRQVVYNTSGEIYRRAADASTPQEDVLLRERPQYPTSWSPDGRTLIFNDDAATTLFDIWIRPPDGKARPLIATPAFENGGIVSPNGKWIALVSSETRRREVYVRPFPEVTRGKWTVSGTGGGYSPRWSRNGRELFYMNGPTLMAVPIEDQLESLRAGIPMELFSGPFDTTQDSNFDVFPDGNHFVMVEADPDARPSRLQLVYNWSAELRRLEAASPQSR